MGNSDGGKFLFEVLSTHIEDADTVLVIGVRKSGHILVGDSVMTAKRSGVLYTVKKVGLVRIEHQTNGMGLVLEGADPADLRPGTVITGTVAGAE